MLHHSYLKAVGKVTPYLAAPGCGVFQLNNKLWKLSAPKTCSLDIDLELCCQNVTLQV